MDLEDQYKTHRATNSSIHNNIVLDNPEIYMNPDQDNKSEDNKSIMTTRRSHISEESKIYSCNYTISSSTEELIREGNNQKDTLYDKKANAIRRILILDIIKKEKQRFPIQKYCIVLFQFLIFFVCLILSNVDSIRRLTNN